MVSTVCGDPDPHRPLARGAAIVSFPLQPSGEGGRIGFFPGPRTAIHDSGRLVGLHGYPFLDQLVSRAALHTPACRRYVVVSRPSLCIVTWSIPTPTPICLAIQVVMGRVAESESFRLS